MKSSKRKVIQILYIDDELNNLLAFKAAFRREFEIYTAQSANEGLKLLQEIPVQIIISDQRMPGCSGVEFFRSIVDRYPDPIRILITGYTDSEALIDAINNGHIYRYLSKPWDEMELRNAIHNAFDTYQTRKQLQVNYEELQKTNDELSRFTYSLSHDLRSPLMSILGIIKLSKIEQSVVDPNGYLDIIEQSVNKLDGFILKVIEYYQNSRSENLSETIEFDTLLSEIVENFKLQNNTINYQTAIEQPVPFRGDSFRISVIFNNLISNAVKYQRVDELVPAIWVKVNVDSSRALITLGDNGIGILNEHLDQIFKLFFRAKNTKRTGNGIGLYIVKDALTKIGGTISVQSKLNKGTVFEISIPNLAVEERVLCE
ncbi:hybrid sensor histidine kinase/response regulator [Solitalea lacus]|uniref:hybrid sensor histidine kinase/response regulator n=1 Tax=Solitalea lacus TaxID=2911172 RepID=UPI001EDBDB96|nr:hybrid sensor histidine kinase/response regulator [Solitalea lacus]UKJ09001.1 hybrid sensor histidine kinase/response regulator [Solitalea lacus]